MNVTNATTPIADQRKAENQRTAELLRAKLIAQRQNTPIRAISGSNTPAKTALASVEPKGDVEKSEKEASSSIDIFGLETLFAEGKAAAEAKVAAQAKLKADAAAATALPEQMEASNTNGQAPQTEPNQLQSGEQTQPPQTNMTPEQPQLPTTLTDDYYADLPIWLEMTAYHDVEYRNSKLRTHKERKALEEEAARIQERLEKLRQAEQATIDSMRTSIAPAPSATPRHPPALPTTMPGGHVQQTPLANKAPTINGVKRAHSPEPVLSEKSARARRQDPAGFRIRGANDNSPDARHTAHRPPSPSSVGLERRISYPDARLHSLDDHRSRDPSLERRQTHYQRNGESHAPGAGAAYNRDRYDTPPSYGARDPARGYDNRGRVSHSSVNRGAAPRPPAGGGYRDHPPPYRGSASLDLRKGGGSSRR